MVDIYWLEQTNAEVPKDKDWLSMSEALRLAQLRFPKRCADWLLGRWTAKRAVARCLKVSETSLSAIEIRAAACGAPVVYFETQPAACTISLTHCCGTAACAIVTCRKVALGCDLEQIEWRSQSFISEFFTPPEQALIKQSPENRFVLPTLLWSAKESALKALNTGLRRDTRSVMVDPEGVSFRIDGWHQFLIRYDEDRVFQGWWRVADHFVRTLVCRSRPNQTIWLNSESSASRSMEENSPVFR